MKVHLLETEDSCAQLTGNVCTVPVMQVLLSHTQMVDSEKSSMLVSLCFALSLLGRRALGAASNNSSGYDLCSLKCMHWKVWGVFKFRVHCYTETHINDHGKIVKIKP